MPQYILKRLGLALLTLFLLSIIVFYAAQVLPGNPGRELLGPFASESAVRKANALLGVNRPLIVQYWSWVSTFVRGDMGTSYQLQLPVRPLLFAALWRSLKLAALAFIIVVPLGILGGVFAALYRGRAPDRMHHADGGVAHHRARVRIRQSCSSSSSPSG